MEIDKQGNFIGHGEYVVFDHVVQLFPEAGSKDSGQVQRPVKR